VIVTIIGRLERNPKIGFRDLLSLAEPRRRLQA
jgi:hypothetical protein